jgi:hypothetical protein
VRGEREAVRGKRKRGWIFEKNLLHHADEKLSESVHTEAILYFS